MGLLDTISSWKAASYERKILNMQAQGLCPECSGSGLNSMALFDFTYYPPYECFGCNGSGLFADWAEMNHQQS